LSDTLPILDVLVVGFILPMLLIVLGCLVLDTVFKFARIRLSRREPKVWKSIKWWLIIDTFLVLVLIALVLTAIMKKLSFGESPAGLVFLAMIFILWNTAGLSGIHPDNLARLRLSRLWISVLCLSMWFKGTVIWTVGSLCIFSLNWALYGLILVGWSVFCLFVWSEITYQPGMFASKHRHIFVMVMYWAVVLMTLQIFGILSAKISQEYADPLCRYRPLPDATQETYNRLFRSHDLAEAPSDGDPYFGVPNKLRYAAPEDMETFIAGRRTSGQVIPETHLLRLLRECSRDLRPILLGALEDPNAYEVLVIRAEWGDRSVKGQLERIYRERFGVYSEAGPEPPRQGPASLGESLELAGTLASVSDGAEGQDRVSYLMEQVVEKTQSLGTGPSLSDPRHADRIMQPFWESLNKLPAENATNLLKHYLRQTQFVDLFTDRRRDMNHLSALLSEGDRELSEEVVGALAGLPSVTESADAPFAESEEQRTMRLTRYRDRNSSRCLDAVFAHLGTGSMRVLLEHLDSGNEQLRAFVAWRVTSLGYDWSDEQLAALLKDSYWKVRLNALFACDPD